MVRQPRNLSISVWAFALVAKKAPRITAPSHAIRLLMLSLALLELDQACSVSQPNAEGNKERAKAPLSAFASRKKHCVNLNWLICGDLMGYCGQCKGCPGRRSAGSPSPDELRRAELQDFRDALEALDERHLGAVLAYVSRLAEA